MSDVHNAKKLGLRVKKYREERDMTREELATAAGLGLDLITAMEEENLYPSIGPLQKVARALNIRLGTFMDDEVTQDPLIVRKGVRDDDLTMKKASNKHAAYVYHSLGKGKTDRNMEPFFIEITPEPIEDRTLSSHEGEELIIVMKGKLLIHYGTEEYILEAGDSIYYNSIVPHYAGATGDEKAEIYAVIYYPR